MFAGQCSEDAYRRGTRELRAFAAVDSPYLARVYDAVLEDNFLYAMEYFPLGSLAAPARPLTRDEVLRAVEHAARAVHALHEAGLAHGDVKPGNVMLHDAPQVGRAHQQVRFGRVAFAEEAVDVGLAALQVVGAHEGRAHQVDEQAVVLSSSSRGPSRSRTAASRPSWSWQSASSSTAALFFGSWRDHPLQLGRGLRQPGRLEERQRQVEADRSLAGHLLEHLAVLRRRLVVAAEPCVGGAKVRPRVHALRLLLERRLVVLDGADDVAFLVPCDRLGEQRVRVGQLLRGSGPREEQAAERAGERAEDGNRGHWTRHERADR